MILIVDDDPHIRKVLGFALKKAGYPYAEAADGHEALAQYQRLNPQLLILDIEMPGFDGMEVCKKIRQQASTPIIFLSCRDDEIDRVLGLELGGDDYITKPFSPRELIARVKAVLRRFEPASPAPAPSPGNAVNPVLRHENLILDQDHFRATYGAHSLNLTVTEFGILRTLMGYPGKVFTRNELMAGAYGPQVIVSDRTIDSHIRRLRRKFKALGNSPVETIHGMGYRLGDCRG